MITPHKYCGLDLAPVKPVLNRNLLIANKYSFRVYELPNLRIIVDGLTFRKKIRAIAEQNEFIYVACSKTLYTVKHQVLEAQEYDEKIIQMLIFHPIHVVATQHKLYINQNKMSFQGILGILHLPTYLNKIILYTANYIKIINIISQEVVATVDLSQVGTNDQSIELVKDTHALDIAAIALRNPSTIVLLNLSTFEKISVYRLEDAKVEDIAINKHGERPFMAVAQESKLVLFNLNTRELVFTHKHQGKIDWVFFNEDQSLYIGSSQLNAIDQLTLDEHKIMAPLRSRKGFSEFITKCAFHGLQEEHLINYLAIARTELRFQSLVNENMAYSKNGTFEKFAFSVMRENDWANILTTDGRQVCLSNTFTKANTKVQFQLKDLPVRTFVTNCGNYGFVATHQQIVRFTMQSGLMQKEYVLRSPLQEFIVDYQNSYVLAALQDDIALYDFVSAQIAKSIPNKKQITCMIRSSSNLVGLADNSFGISVMDGSTLNFVRQFSNCHESKILDLKFTPDNQHLVSSSLDKSLKVWNLVYGTLVQEIQLARAIISFDISQDQLISVFLNSRQIAIWRSHLCDAIQGAKAKRQAFVEFHSDLEPKTRDPRASLYSQQHRKIETEPSQQTLTLPELDSDTEQYVKFTTLEEGRWVPIQHLDQIRERNRVKLAEADIKIPFFMDFRNADQERKAILEELKGEIQEKSRIMKVKKDQYLAELKSEFESYLEEGQFEKLLALLKSLSPTSFDYELRSTLIGKPKNIVRILQFFDEIMSNPNELDLKVTYLLRFIEVAREDFALIENDAYKELLRSIANKLEQTYLELEDLKSYTQAVIDYAKTRI